MGVILAACVIFAIFLKSIGKILVYMLSAGFLLVAIYMLFSTEGNLAAEVLQLAGVIKTFILENLRDLLRETQNLIKTILSGV